MKTLIIVALMFFIGLGHAVALPRCGLYAKVAKSYEDNGFSPHSRGIDHQGDLWIVWLNAEQDWHITHTARGGLILCLVYFGEDWGQFPDQISGNDS